MQRGQDARHGNRKDAQHAVATRAHNQQHHNGNVRPWGPPCTVSARLCYMHEPQVSVGAEVGLG